MTMLFDPRRYVQVAASLRGQIAAGILRPGELVPTLTSLEREHGVSRTTVQHAMRVLVAEGLVGRSPGLHGYQVCGTCGDRTAEDLATANLPMQLAAALDRRGITVAIDVDRVRIRMGANKQLVIKPSVRDNGHGWSRVWSWRHNDKTWSHPCDDWEGAAEVLAVYITGDPSRSRQGTRR